MRKIILTLIILLNTTALFAQDIRSVCEEINKLNTAVLNGSIERRDAATKFKQLIAGLKSKVNVSNNKSWIFPLQGYNYRAIGGTNGNGYSDKGYNYLDGNKHAAHPAHDIFIRDKNQDCFDDKSRLPVNVLVVSDGVVIACTDEWETQSLLRGGKYIWIYHPQLNIITYYAHNRAIFVKPGDLLKQGQKIAEVGRTGYNAYKRRSPTHLHFSAFQLVDGLPVPYNCYPQLKTTLKL